MTTQLTKQVPCYKFTFDLDIDYEYRHSDLQSRVRSVIPDSTPQAGYNDGRPLVYTVIIRRMLIPSPTPVILLVVTK